MAVTSAKNHSATVSTNRTTQPAGWSAMASVTVTRPIQTHAGNLEASKSSKSSKSVVYLRERARARVPEAQAKLDQFYKKQLQQRTSVTTVNTKTLAKVVTGKSGETSTMLSITRPKIVQCSGQGGEKKLVPAFSSGKSVVDAAQDVSSMLMPSLVLTKVSADKLLTNPAGKK